MFRGPPSYTRVAGTALDWVSNTNADVLYDTDGRRYYVLVAGRWYRATLLTGPWSFVASTDLPVDFRRIPPATPAGVVLAAVAGTPRAEEAVIANSIPQTATVPRVNGPVFSPVFDGAPQLRAVDGTALEYVVNSPTPIIRVDASLYYALRAGVWFRSAALGGPWYVAAYVPAVIYTIPPASPLHYVAYVQVYGSTAAVVYVGYTPGYLGRVVAPRGVVVYKNSGNGWQQHTSGGWQSASGDSSWADQEQQARSEGTDRFNTFSQSGGAWASRFEGGGGGWASGGGWGDRFGGGWGGRSFGGRR